MTNRARITLPDVVLLAASLLFAAPLISVFLSELNANAGELSVGAAYIWQLLVPVLLLVVLWVIWSRATVGAR